MAEPAPTIRVTFPSAGIVNITPDVLGIKVRRGSFFDPGSGRFLLLSASGKLSLDTSHGMFDHVGGYAASHEYSYLLDCQYALGNHVRWRGATIAKPVVRLWAAPQLQWPLLGRAWQPLRTELIWAQQPTDSTLQDVFDDMIAATPATVGPARFPPGAYMRGARSLGGLASTINAMALATGTQPVEHNDGSLALCDLHELGAVTPVVAGQTVMDRVSTIERMPPIAPRRLRLSGVTEQTNVSEPLATAPHHSSAQVHVVSEFIWPDDIAEILWDQPTVAWVTDPGTGDLVSLVPGTFFTATDTVGSRSITHLQVDAVADLDDPYLVTFHGRTRRRTAINNALIDTGFAVPGQPSSESEIVTTEPWLDLLHHNFVADAQGTYMGIINSPMIIAKIRILLDTPEKAQANWQPGWWSEFHADAADFSMLVLNITDQWTVDNPPFVDIEGIIPASSLFGPGPAGGDVIVTPTPPPLPAPTAPPAPTVTLDGDDGVSLQWIYPVPVDIARAPMGERGALVVVIASDVTSPYIDAPGVGSWDYRLGEDGVWGPWATITVPQPAPPAGEMPSLGWTQLAADPIVWRVVGLPWAVGAARNPFSVYIQVPDDTPPNDVLSAAARDALLADIGAVAPNGRTIIATYNNTEYSQPLGSVTNQQVFVGHPFNTALGWGAFLEMNYTNSPRLLPINGDAWSAMRVSPP